MPQAQPTITLWMEQCAAAEQYIRPRFGLNNALEYLVGEKFIDYLDSPNVYPNWQADLPKFAAEIRRQFTSRELQNYLDEVRRGRQGSRQRKALLRQARALLLPSKIN